jgi:hypothetical protein
MSSEESSLTREPFGVSYLDEFLSPESSNLGGGTFPLLLQPSTSSLQVIKLVDEELGSDIN